MLKIFGIDRCDDLMIEVQVQLSETRISGTHRFLKVRFALSADHEFVQKGYGGTLLLKPNEDPILGLEADHLFHFLPEGA